MDVFFACGAPKSGTTWLQRVLDAHPEVSCSGEGHFIERFSTPLAEVVREYNRHLGVVETQVYEGRPSYAPVDQTAFDAVVRSFILARLTARPLAPEVRWVGDKTPGNVIYLTQLNRLFPGARFVNIVRDPRDMVVSRLEHAVRAGLPRTDHDGQHQIIRRAAQEWVTAVRAAQTFADANPGRLHSLRYEDMIADPEGEAGRLFAFLGVSTDAALVAQIAAATSFEALSGRKPGQEDRTRFLRKGVAGDWRANLDPVAAELVAEAAGEWLALWGYADRAATAHPGRQTALG